MLKETHVTIQLSGKNIEWFREMGIQIERIPVEACPTCGSRRRFWSGRTKWTQTKLYECLDCHHSYVSTKMPEVVTIPISQLAPTSKCKVTRICDTCGKEEIVTFCSWMRAKSIRDRNRLDNCKSCSNRLCQTKANPEERLRDRSNLEERQWAQSVKARDKYICQCCGQRGHKLVSHHILPWERYPELQLDVSNGITLCESCHADYHSSTGGTKGLFNCNAETLTAFIAMRRGTA